MKFVRFVFNCWVTDGKTTQEIKRVCAVNPESVCYVQPYPYHGGEYTQITVSGFTFNVSDSFEEVMKKLEE